MRAHRPNASPAALPQAHRRALLLALLPGTALAQTAAPAPPSGRPRFSILTSSRPPLTDSPDRKGFLNEIARTAFGRLGIEVEFSLVPNARTMINVNSGLDDGNMVNTAGWETLYPNTVYVPEAVLLNEFVAYVRQPQIRIHSWNDLKPYAVAYTANWKAIDDLMPPVRELTLTPTPNELLPLLLQGRVDVILTSRRLGAVQGYASKHGLIMQTPPLLVEPSFIYLHKKHAALVPRLTQVLRDMKAEGSFQRIYDATLRAATGY